MLTFTGPSASLKNPGVVRYACDFLFIIKNSSPHARIRSGKKGYAIALRTGPNMPECERIIASIEHFYGHLEIECAGHIGFTGIEYREN